jgi:hypothetical protein
MGGWMGNLLDINLTTGADSAPGCSGMKSGRKWTRFHRKTS